MHACVQISGDITKRLAPERKKFKGWILVEVQIGEIQGKHIKCSTCSKISESHYLDMVVSRHVLVW
jgi:hypothetical protein